MIDAGHVVALPMGQVMGLADDKENSPANEISGATHMKPITWQKRKKPSNTSLQLEELKKRSILESLLVADCQ